MLSCTIISSFINVDHSECVSVLERAPNANFATLINRHDKTITVITDH